jgi:hypothetical protein
VRVSLVIVGPDLTTRDAIGDAFFGALLTGSDAFARISDHRWSRLDDADATWTPIADAPLGRIAHRFWFGDTNTDCIGGCVSMGCLLCKLSAHPIAALDRPLHGRFFLCCIVL